MYRTWPPPVSRVLVTGATLGLVALSLPGARSARPGELPRQQEAPPPTTQPTSAPAPPDAQPPAEGPEDRLVSGLVGSKHDFRKINASVRELCLPCHTPHVVGVPVPRLDARAPTLVPLRPYQAPGIELTGWSLLCLGCHDGITAPDVYASSHAIRVTADLANSLAGVKGLRSHPVGVVYPLAAEGYRPRAEVEAAGLPLPDGRIQCTTCHDAHNTAGHAGMLRLSNDRSRVCLTCHRR